MFKRFFLALGSVLLLSFPAVAQTSASQAVTGQYQNAPQTNCTTGPCFTTNNPAYASSGALSTVDLPITALGGTWEIDGTFIEPN